METNIRMKFRMRSGDIFIEDISRIEFSLGKISIAGIVQVEFEDCLVATTIVENGGKEVYPTLVCREPMPLKEGQSLRVVHDLIFDSDA